MLFSRVIRPIKCQSKPTTSWMCWSCYIISMPASAQHKWRLSRQYWIHSLKAQISCAFGLPRKPGLVAVRRAKLKPGCPLPKELWVIFLSQVSFLWVMELGRSGKDRAGARPKAAGRWRPGARKYWGCLRWHLPLRCILNADVRPFSGLCPAYPSASLTTRPDAHCTVLWAYTLSGGA